MTVELDGKVIDESKLDKETTVAIENMNQLNQQRDALMVNLERNSILLAHYSNIVKNKTLKDK